MSYINIIYIYKWKCQIFVAYIRYISSLIFHTNYIILQLNPVIKNFKGSKKSLHSNENSLFRKLQMLTYWKVSLLRWYVNLKKKSIFMNTNLFTFKKYCRFYRRTKPINYHNKINKILFSLFCIVIFEFLLSLIYLFFM